MLGESLNCHLAKLVGDKKRGKSASVDEDGV